MRGEVIPCLNPTQERDIFEDPRFLAATGLLSSTLNGPRLPATRQGLKYVSFHRIRDDIPIILLTYEFAGILYDPRG